MKAFVPDFLFKKTTNISPEFLKSIGVKNLLLDVDNTLATHGNPSPAQGIVEWLLLLKKSGIKTIIVSNNIKKRVEPFARELGLGFVHFSAKPTPMGLLRAMRRLGAKRSNTAMVGDQIFTDILGAHIVGIKAIMVLAILAEGGNFFKLKRNFEKRYIDRYIDTKGEIL